VHLHVVNFEIISRRSVVWDSATTEDDRSIDTSVTSPAGDGTYLIARPQVEHTGDIGEGFRIGNPTSSGSVEAPEEFYEGPRSDTVAALPGQVTTIRATFDRYGLYVWHCHILAHEDHEMMREFWVGPQLKKHGKQLLVYKDECNKDHPCGFCEGDCETDDDCDEALICYHRDSFGQVPFCAGEGVAHKDYCTFPFKEKEYVRDSVSIEAIQKSGSSQGCELSAGVLPVMTSLAVTLLTFVII